MLPPQIIVVDELLPEVRKRVAHALYRAGSSQEEIGRVLGTSQAMVSKYLKEPPEAVGTLDEAVEIVSRELIAAALAGEGLKDLTDRFCSLVERCMSQGLIARRYSERFPGDVPRSVFGTLCSGNERADVLRDLASSLDFLKGHPIPALVPAVKVNIAFALEGATKRDEVASFPGRLPDVDGIFKEAGSPEFGCSHHLSSILLSAMEGDPGSRAVINVKYSPEVQNALKVLGWGHSTLGRGHGRKRDTSLGMDLGRHRMVVDPGDFGIEPCLYLFGGSPLEVASKAWELQNAITGQMGGEQIG